MTNRIPESIEPCPIIDSIIELRFSSNFPAGALFGIIYNSFKDNYKKVENLPISQLPEQIRLNDPNLKYKPLYKISNPESMIQVGDNVFTVSVKSPYKGWSKFSVLIYNSFEKLIKTGCIKHVERLGMRYINFFPDNIFNNIDLNITLSGKDLIPQNTLLRTEINHDLFKSTLQITNNIEQNGKIGSIIDIDTFTYEELSKFEKNISDFIEMAHSNEKELFFSLLKKNFLSKFNPKY